MPNFDKAADRASSASSAAGTLAPDDHAAIDLTLRYENQLLEKVTREVEVRLASRLPYGYSLWRSSASVLGGIVYGFVLARVIADPQVWSGLTAIVGPVIVSVVWWRTEKRDPGSHGVDAAVGSVFTALAFIWTTLAMEWGYVSGLTDRTSAFAKLRSEVSVLGNLIDATRSDLEKRLDETRHDRTGFRTGFLYMEDPLVEVDDLAADRGDILVVQALFDVPPDYDACKVSLAIMGDQTSKRKIVEGWTNQRLEMAHELEGMGEVQFGFELLDCRAGKQTSAVRPVVGYRVAWGLRGTRHLESATEMLKVAEPLRVPGVSLGRTWYDQNMYSATCNNSDGYEKIYDITISEDVDIELELDANFDAIVAVLDVAGRDDDDLFYEVVCRRQFVSDPGDKFALSLSPGHYLVIVEGLAEAGGTFGLSVSVRS